MGNWLHEGKEYTKMSDFPDTAVGFVYKVTNTKSGKFYVGKKILRNVLTKKLTKKEISEWVKPGRIPKKRKEVKESNWTDYYGSSKLVMEDIKLLGKDAFTREILKICTAKKQMSYWETYYQMVMEVLSVDSYNENIAGKWYRRDVSPAVPDLQDDEE
jgi:hypothetical protein